jgi:ribonuclease PH
MEFVSPEGLRLDGRRPKELRQLKAELGVLKSADGSAMFEMGNTKVGGTLVLVRPGKLVNTVNLNFS